MLHGLFFFIWFDSFSFSQPILHFINSYGFLFFLVFYTVVFISLTNLLFFFICFIILITIIINQSGTYFFEQYISDYVDGVHVNVTLGSMVGSTHTPVYIFLFSYFFERLSEFLFFLYFRENNI